MTQPALPPADRSGPALFVRTAEKGKGEERVELTVIVKSIIFEDNEKKADKIQIVVDNYDLSQIDSPFWRQGREVEIAWGYRERFAAPRNAIIKKVTGFTTLKIEAHGKSILMDRDTKCRLFENVTRSQVVTTIANENGFIENVEIDETEEVYETITQARMSDAQFLRHLANKEGFEFFVDFDGLHWHRARFGQTPVRRLHYFTDPLVSDIQQIQLDSDLTARPGRVSKKGRNPIEKKTFNESGEEATTKNEDALADLVEVVDPRTGETSPADSNTAQGRTEPSSEKSAAAAARTAKGRYLRSKRKAVKLKIKAIGDPNVLAKSVIEIVGIGEKLSGLYYVEQAKHNVSTAGYSMDLLVRRGGSNRLRGGFAGAGTGGGTFGSGTGGTATQQKKNQKKATDDSNQLVQKVDPRTGEITYLQGNKPK